MGYLRLIPTVYVVLAAFGAVFIVIATLLRAQLGSRYVWRFLAIYIVIVCASKSAEQDPLPLRLRSACMSWLAIVAVTPAAVALVAMVDYINLIVVTSR